MAKVSWARGHADLISIVVILGLAALIAWYASYAFSLTGPADPSSGTHKTRLAMAIGALGGLAHELIQSRGKLRFFRRMSDGVQIGSLSSLVLGAIAGVLGVTQLLAPDTYTLATGRDIALQAFIAGLALKGLAGAGVTAATEHAQETITKVRTALGDQVKKPLRATKIKRPLGQR